MFYQQVIDTQDYNDSSTNLPDTTTVEVNQNNLELYFYDPSYLLANNLKDSPAHLAFYTDTVNNPISIIQFLPTMIPTIVKLCPVK
jgi:hypothetical protein